MCSIKLRDYQTESLEKLSGLLESECPIKAFGLVLPTGAGKSVVIAALIDKILSDYETDGLSILVTTWSRRIISQNESALARLTKHDYSANVDFCTVQSLKNYWNRDYYDVIIVDECHKMYVGTEGYKEITSRMYNSNGSLANEESSTVVFGFTATPHRNKHQCSIGDSGMFIPVEQLVSYERLMSEGYLVRPEYIKCRLFSYDCDSLDINTIGDFSSESMEKQCRKALSAIATEILRAHTCKSGVRNHCTLVFLPSLRICDEVLSALASKQKRGEYKGLGLKIDIINGETDEADREEIISNADVILNCGVLTTGVDITRVDSLIVCRATKSPTLWRQIVGRGLRTHEGKKKCNVVDCGGNVERFGDDLDETPMTSKAVRKQLPIMGECPQCHRYISASCKTCKFCGTVLRTDEQIHALKLQRIYLEGGMLPVESYSERSARIPDKGLRHTVTVKFAYGRQRQFTFSEHPYSQEKYEEYIEVLDHCRKKDEILFIRVEEIKGFDTITDAKVIHCPPGGWK